MNDADHHGPAAPMFIAKVALGLVWIIAGSQSAAILFGETPKSQDIAAALFLILAPLTWLFVKTRAMARADELEHSIAVRGLVHGLLIANIWTGVLTGGNVLSSLFLGAGEVNVSGLMQEAVIFIGQQPAVAFLLSESMSFSLLRKYAKKEG